MKRALTLLSIVSLFTVLGCSDRSRDQGNGYGSNAATDRSAAADTNAHRTPQTPAAPQVGGTTAFDQGENPQDLDITKRIRQAVVDDASLSVASKNVTIVTNQGKVVLKGEVPSQTEATRLVAIAQQVAGQTNVNNQLEVKSLG